MEFTPAAGLVMSTPSGDLDPGLLSFFARSENMTSAQFEEMVNHESGLLGVSETSSDVRDLLARVERERRAAEALALFCYQAKKWIGENASLIRARICDGLRFSELPSIGSETRRTRR